MTIKVPGVFRYSSPRCKEEMDKQVYAVCIIKWPLKSTEDLAQHVENTV